MSLIEMRIVCSSLAACLLALVILVRRRGRWQPVDYVSVVATLLGAQEIPVGFLLAACGFTPNACRAFGADIPEAFRFDIFFAGAMLMLASVAGVIALLKAVPEAASERQGQTPAVVPEKV